MHLGLAGFVSSWRDLLSCSNADPLFNSPEWLATWWSHYGPQLGAELEILAAISGEQLLGLVLLHRRRTIHRLGIDGLRCELLGTAWRVSGAGFSERAGFILRKGHEAEASRALCEHLLGDAAWADLVVSHTSEGGATAAALRRMASGCRGYLRHTDPMEAWEINLAGGFEEVLKRIGSGTRARIMGSRRRLQGAGIMRERLLRPGEFNEGWNIFASLYEKRWQRPFSVHLQSFYGAIAALQAAGGTPVFSVLEFNDKPFSVLVNFRAARREYSIVSAFVPVEVKRVSPGWLHLGLAIERACADGMTHFDLLGGEGKREQYKAAFAGTRTQLECLQLVRDRRLAMMYRGWDLLNRIRERIGAAASR